MTQNFHFGGFKDDNQSPPPPGARAGASHPTKGGRKVSPSRTKMMNELGVMSKFDIEKMFLENVNKVSEQVRLI